MKLRHCYDLLKAAQRLQKWAISILGAIENHSILYGDCHTIIVRMRSSVCGSVCLCVSTRVPHFNTIALIRQSVSMCVFVSVRQLLEAGNTFLAVADKQIKKL